MRWISMLLISGLIALTAMHAQAETRDPYRHFFSPKLGDLAEDLAQARNEGKKGILLMFEMDDCPFCARMKETVLNRPAVQDWYRQHFVSFSIDVKGDVPITDFKGRATSEKAFALEQRARATPVFIFYDLNGEPITRFTGATQTADEFILLGRYVVEGRHREMPFNVYKRQHASAK